MRKKILWNLMLCVLCIASVYASDPINTNWYVMRSSAYSSVNTCKKMVIKNDKLYPNYSRSTCYNDWWYYYYNICAKWTDCKIAQKENDKSSSNTTNVNLLSACKIDTSLWAKLKNKLDTILNSIDKKLWTKNKITKWYVYGFYDYSLWKLANNSKYKNNQTIQKVIKYLRNKFSCGAKSWIGTNAEVSVDIFLWSVFGWWVKWEDRKKYLKNFIVFMEEKWIKKEVLRSYINEYNVIPDDDKNILLSYLNNSTTNTESTNTESTNTGSTNTGSTNSKSCSWTTTDGNYTIANWKSVYDARSWANKTYKCNNWSYVTVWTWNKWADYCTDGTNNKFVSCNSTTNTESTNTESTNTESTNIENTNIENTNTESTNIENTNTENTNTKSTNTENTNTEKRWKNNTLTDSNARCYASAAYPNNSGKRFNAWETWYIKWGSASNSYYEESKCVDGSWVSLGEKKLDTINAKMVWTVPTDGFDSHNWPYQIAVSKDKKTCSVNGKERLAGIDGIPVWIDKITIWKPGKYQVADCDLNWNISYRRVEVDSNWTQHWHSWKMPNNNTGDASSSTNANYCKWGSNSEFKTAYTNLKNWEIGSVLYKPWHSWWKVKCINWKINYVKTNPFKSCEKGYTYSGKWKCKKSENTNTTSTSNNICKFKTAWWNPKNVTEGFHKVLFTPRHAYFNVVCKSGKMSRWSKPFGWCQVWYHRNWSKYNCIK